MSPTAGKAPWGRPVFSERADRRAPLYRSRGQWRPEPFDLVAEGAHRYGGAAALRSRESHLSFEELHTKVDAATGALHGLGIGPGDAVLVVARNDLPSVVAIHAVVRSGAVALLALASAGSAYIQEVLDEARPSLVVEPEDAGLSGVSWGVATRSRTSELLDGVPSGGRSHPRDPDAPAVVIFTSGSTARPKGVVHSLNTICASATNFAAAMGLGPASGLFVVSPVATVTGLLHAVVVPPLIGARAVLVDKWEPSGALDLLMDTRATFFGGPDVLLDRILEEASRRDLGEVPLRGVCVGGSMNDRRILRRAESDFRITVMPSYGSSEAPVTCAASHDEVADVRLADEGPPLEGVEVRIGSARDPGECCVRGPHVFLGYVDPELDRTAFEDDWFCTGDLAALVSGRLQVSGRLHDVVIRNGLKVPVAEVEAAVMRIAGVVQAAGFGEADPQTGERLVMAVRLLPGHTVGLASLGEALVAAGLAKWKLPEELVVWDGPFPETATGKVHRPSVAERSAGMPRLLAGRLEAAP